MSGRRKFLEDVFSYYSKGEMDKFFNCFDTQISWTIHGDHDLAGNYRTLDEIKDVYKRYTEFLRDKPKHRLRYLVVEGDKAMALPFDEVVGKDGKNYSINSTLFLEISKENKIFKVDNFLDTQQMLDIIKAASKPRKVA